MRSLERVNIRTNVRTYVLTYIRTGQTLYPLHNFVVRGDNKVCKPEACFLCSTHPIIVFYICMKFNENISNHF